jgi:hypothetical protein
VNAMTLLVFFVLKRRTHKHEQRTKQKIRVKRTGEQTRRFLQQKNFFALKISDGLFATPCFWQA